MPPTVLPAEEQTIPTGRFKPLVSFKSHKWSAFFTFLMITMLGVGTAWQVGKTVYSATAMVFISPRFISNLDVDKNLGLDYLGRTDYQMYLEQQEKLFTRPDVLKEALRIPKVQNNWLLPNENEEMGFQRLSQSISAQNKRTSSFMSVTLTSSKGEGLEIVLNGVIDVYLKKTQQESLYGSDDRVRVLQQRREELIYLISQRSQQRTQIGEELGVTTFQENSLNPYDDILIEHTKAYNEAHRQHVEAEARLNLLTQGTPGQTILDVKVKELVAGDSALNNFKAKLTDKRIELFIQTLGLMPQHPSKQRADQEIAKIEQDIQEATTKLTQEIRTRLLDQAKTEVTQTQGLEKTALEELNIQRNKANHYTTTYNQALVLNKEIERAYNLLNEIDNKINFLTIEATAPGYVRSYTPATKPTFTNNRRLILLGFLGGALVFAFLVPVLIDLLDRRLHTPGEIHKTLGFAPMAWILDRTNQENELLATDYLHRLALALARDWRTHHTRAFVLTSVKPGGGTTTLTLELAQKLNDIGVRSLALELNAFKPDLRYCNSTIYPYGLTTLLKPHPPRISPETLILKATASLPDRLPVGETSHRHLVTHGKLSGILEQLYASYDLIILDTPPILLSADAELLGEVAGGVLIIIEAGQITPGELKRAAHLLTRLNPPVVGAILNKVKVYQGGGYFAELIKEYLTGKKLRPTWFKRWFWG